MLSVLESNYSVIKEFKHVKINELGIKSSSKLILTSLIAKPLTSSDWPLVPLHPIPSLHSSREILNWIFIVSALNFSFWSDLPSNKRYGIRYKQAVDGKKKSEAVVEVIHTGYWSLIAALHRAKDNGINITEPRFYLDCEVEVLQSIFKSDQEEEIPLLDERLKVLREVGGILCQKFEGSYESLITLAKGSAIALVDLIVTNFPCFDDRSTYNSKEVLIRKRAQILVAETWSAFGSEGPGKFHDIDQLTMFADYRVPQILHSLSTLDYSPHLTSLLLSNTNLPQGSIEEIEIRVGSIIAVEEIRLEIIRLIKQEGLDIKAPMAIELDFLLWDLAKVEEGKGTPKLPHHRTRSIFY